MAPSCNFRKIRANFCCSLPSRSDGNIATTRSSTLILIKQQNRSIQTIFSRRWCVGPWCVYVNDVFWSGWSRTLLKTGRIFQRLKALIEHLPPLSRTWAYRPHLSGAGPTSPKPLRAPRNKCSRIHDVQ